ncbi:MAG: hypothetical protein HY332_06740 [Chloroflexi bacterium]|nr:hypothetical protein [Chloroflexota bacterium]
MARVWTPADEAIQARDSGSRRHPHLSARARELGFETLDDLKLAVLKQRPTWWLGNAYHCPVCDLDFIDSRRAAEHVVLEQHPVLRMDSLRAE